MVLQSIEYFLGIDNKVELETGPRFLLFIDCDFIPDRHNPQEVFAIIQRMIGYEKNLFSIKTQNGYHFISANLYTYLECVEHMERLCEMGIEDTSHKKFMIQWGASTLRISAKCPNEFKLIDFFHGKELMHKSVIELYEVMTDKKFFYASDLFADWPITIRGYRWKKWLSKRLLLGNSQNLLPNQNHFQPGNDESL